MGTLNLWRESPDAVRDLQRVSMRCEILVLNEAANHLDAIRKFCRQDPTWSVVIPRGHARAATQNVILFRNGIFKLKRTSARQMCAGVGPSPERWMTKARLEHRPSGRIFKVRGTHMNSHVQMPPWWRLPRFRQYRIHVENLVTSMRHSRVSEVNILAMDCNASYGHRATRTNPFFPYRALKRANAVSSYAVLGMPLVGTAGRGKRRYIDAIFLVDRPFVKFVKHHVVNTVYSDHNALVAILRISGKPK